MTDWSVIYQLKSVKEDLVALLKWKLFNSRYAC